MKKRIAILLIGLLSVTLASVAVGCNEPEQPATTPHQHTYSDEWTYDETNHWYQATCEHTNRKKGSAQHSFGNPTVTKQPTCGEEGEQTRSCACGYVKTESVPATGVHTFGNPIVTQEPTCGEDGEQTSTCTVCAYVKTEPVPATGEHTLSTPTVTQEPTCGEEGVQTSTCTTCSYAKTEPVPATGVHRMTRVTAKEANCLEEGNISYWKCRICDRYFTTRTCEEEITDKNTVMLPIDSSVHKNTINYGQNTTTITHSVSYTCCNKQLDDVVACTAYPDGDCTTDDCCACGRVLTAKLSEHSLQYNTDFTAAKTHTFSCTNEGCIYSKQENHSYNERVSEEYWAVEATCVSANAFHPFCECGYVNRTQTFLSGTPLGHEFVSSPTATDWCKDSTKHWLQCSRCDEISQENAHMFEGTECSSCGYDQTHTHSAQTIYMSNNDGHWNVCAGCNEQLSFSAHSFTQEVAEEKYLQQAANCISSANYYYSCICGRTSFATFSHGAKNSANHVYTQDKDDSAAVKIAGDCLHKAIYYKSCPCGAISTAETDIFEGKRDFGRHIENTFIYVKNYDGTHAKLNACCGLTAIDAEPCSGGTATATAQAVCRYCNQPYGALKRTDDVLGEGMGTLTLTVASNKLEVNGTKYVLYEGIAINPANVTVRIMKGEDTDGTVYTMTALTENYVIPSGNYTVEVSYRNNVSSYPVAVSAANVTTLTAGVSPVFLGGSVTMKQGKETSTLNSSTSGWTHLNDRPDSINFTKNAMTYQDGQSGTRYYLESTFDTTKSTDGILTYGFGGLMISHGTDNLNGGKNDYRLAVNILEKSLVLCVATGNWNGTDKRIIANLEELNISFDETAVTLGVVRDGTDYFFYVDGTYVTSYRFAQITEASGFGAISLSSICKLNDFNYSFNSELIDALKAFAPTAPKTMDLFIIAGQSNAVGISKYDFDTIASKHPTIRHGFTNVWFAGDALNGSGSSTVHNIMNWQGVRLGMGLSNGHIGAEVGMAVEFADSNKYTGTHYAGIVKYAFGGTSLLENFEGSDWYEGNWSPPSYLQYLRDNDLPIISDGYLSGGLYRKMIIEVTTRIAELEAMGFTVTLKGLFWMQGESNIWDMGENGYALRDREYTKAFECFVNDTRKDLNAPDMKFFIGEVSRTYSEANPGCVNTVAGFIRLQNQIARSIDGCYIVNSSVYDINQMIDGVNTVVGSDRYHWGGNEMYEIGKLVGQSMLANAYN